MEKDMGKTTQKRYVGNNRYCLEKTLGKGGFGITWLAVDQENEQKVVIKELCPPPGETREKEIRNFLREARVMASLHSVKEIVKVLNYFEEQGNAYIVMEYLRVTSLRYYLECQDEPLSFEKARNLLLPVMDGLEQMHKKHILHRDLTPDNLMLRENGSLCIIDFGSAREITEDDRTKTVLFKSGYAPPEQYQAHGKQKAWTDVYSLCAVLYEMITGAIPEDSLLRKEKDTLYPPSMYGAEITPEQEKALLRGMALDGHDRYASIKELKEALLEEKKPEWSTNQKEKNKNQKFRIRTAMILGACMTGVLMAGNSLREKEQEVQYAGNFDRRAEEAQKFLELIRTNAVSSKETEDGKSIIYELSKKTVSEYGYPCNKVRFSRTDKDLDAYLTQENFSYKKEEKETECTAAVSEYGLTETDFHQDTEYQIEDFCTITAERDLVNGDILELTMTCQKGKGIEPGELASKLLLFLADAEDPDNKTAGDLIAKDRELQNQQDTGSIHMYQWEEGILIFRESREDFLKIQIVPRKKYQFFQESAYSAE